MKNVVYPVALSPKELAAVQKSAVEAIARWVSVEGITNESKLKTFFICSGNVESEATRLAHEYADKPQKNFADAYSKDFGPEAEDARKQCHIN